MIAVQINGIDYVPRVEMPRFSGERSGAYLRRMRLRRKWSMQYVAEACGSNTSTMHDIERGQHMPNIRTLTAMAGLYGVTLDEIVRGESK